MPPQLNPGRVRYQSSAPTGSAGTATKSTGPLGTWVRPVATQAPSCTVTPGAVRSTANNRRRAGTAPAGVVCAVTRARSSEPASEHQGFVPSNCQPAAPRVALTRCPEPSAANTPQLAELAAAGAASAWARIARASVCASSTRAAVRSAAATVARASKSSRVRPVPGCGNSAAVPTAKSRARPASPSTAQAAAANPSRASGGVDRVASRRPLTRTVAELDSVTMTLPTIHPVPPGRTSRRTAGSDCQVRSLGRTRQHILPNDVRNRKIRPRCPCPTDGNRASVPLIRGCSPKCDPEAPLTGPDRGHT
jgi:hypothetical protein